MLSHRGAPARVWPVRGAARVFIDDSFFPPTTASAYPSTINVPSLSGSVDKVTVSIFGFTHDKPRDVDILLAGPAGQSLILMFDAGANFPVSGRNITFEDGFGQVPDLSLINSGTYRPTNREHFDGDDDFPSPAPGNAPTATRLDTFNNQSPAGAWSLFVVDDATFSAGAIFGGWSITISPQALEYSFSETVGSYIGASNLSLLNQTTSTNITSSPSTSMPFMQISYTFPSFLRGILPDGNYRAQLQGFGDVAGNMMSPSPDVYSFFVLGGDANRDRSVDEADLDVLAGNWQQSPRIFSQGDFNYDSRVDSRDLYILAARWQTTLPALATVQQSARLAGAAFSAVRVAEQIL
ncbi:hypothetical protein [Fontivita pretiosa]|uniref:hypothetical protein n=1 Tax=Fontivita pretiosa TaxID=2989684 RepID=UPI003D182D36